MTEPSDDRARVLAALTAWAEAGCGSAFVLYGPAGAGKRTLVDGFMASAPAKNFQCLHVRVGCEQGVNFAREVLLRLAAPLMPDAAPFTQDPKSVRSRLLNWLWNWEADESEDTRPLLLAVSNPEASLDGNLPGRHWRLGPGTPALAWLLVVSGTREEAEAWLKKLELSSAAVSWASLELPHDEGAASEPQHAFHAQAASVRAALERHGASQLLDALGILAATFLPLTWEDLAELLGLEPSALRASVAPRYAELSLLQVEGQPERLSFRHPLARTAWLAVDPERAQGHRCRLDEVSIALLERASAGQSTDAGAALRRQAVTRAFAVNAPPQALLGACEPTFAWPLSADDLVERRSDLDHARLRACAQLTQSEFVPKAVALLAAIELAQGALTSVDQRESPPPDPFAAWQATAPSLFAARCLLARAATTPLKDELLRAAARSALRNADSWDSPSTPEQLLDLARLVDEAERARVARLALTALRAQARLLTPLTLVALRFLPPHETQSLLDEAIALAASDVKPGQAFAQLTRGWQKNGPLPALEPREIEALYRAVLALPRDSAANGLAALLPVLEGSARDSARAAVYAALLGLDHEDDAGEGDVTESSPPAPANERLNLESVDRAFCSAAVVPVLSRAEVQALLQSSTWTWSGEALVLRLAAEGEAEQALERVLQLTSDSVVRTSLLLRAATLANSPDLLLQARASLTSLPTERALELIAAYPQAMLTLLGLEAVIQLASNPESELAYVRTRALQALCPEVPEADRPPLAALVVRAFWDDGGADALDAVLRVAPWLAPHDALLLYSTSLDGGQGLARALDGWSGVGSLAPLLAHAGGDTLISAVYPVLELAERWLKQAQSTTGPGSS